MIKINQIKIYSRYQYIEVDSGVLDFITLNVFIELIITVSHLRIWGHYD